MSTSRAFRVATRVPAVVLLLAVTGCQPGVDPDADGHALPNGSYTCSSTFYSFTNNQVRVTPVGLTIEIDGDGYSTSDDAGGSYDLDSATGDVIWRGGGLDAIATTFERNSSGAVLALQQEQGATQGQWLCTNGGGTTTDDGGDQGAAPVTVALGAMALMPDGWTVRVVDVQVDATAEVLAFNQYNQPPASDRQFLLVTIEFTRGTGSGSGEVFTAGNLLAVTPSGTTYAAGEARCGDYPDAINAERLDPSETSTGNVCWSIARSDAESVFLAYRNGMSGGPTVELMLR